MNVDSSFWNRRRAAVAAEEKAEKAALEAQAHAEAQATLEEKTDDELLAELELPVPETLKVGDDFSAFMSKAVPDRLRRRALRTLWKVNPVLANLDELVDYGEDFTDSAMVIENMQTAYQVGKGMLKHIEEMARQAEEADAPEAEPEEDEALEDAPIVAQTEEEEPREAPEPVFAEAPEEEMRPLPRRMKFTVEERA